MAGNTVKKTVLPWTGTGLGFSKKKGTAFFDFGTTRCLATSKGSWTSFALPFAAHAPTPNPSPQREDALGEGNGESVGGGEWRERDLAHRPHRRRRLRRLRPRRARVERRSAGRHAVVPRRRHDAEARRRIAGGVRPAHRPARGRERAARDRAVGRPAARGTGRRRHRRRRGALSDAGFPPHHGVAVVRVDLRRRAPPSTRRRRLQHRRGRADLSAVRRGAEDVARARHSGILAMGTVDSLLLGFSVALQPDVLWYAFLGCLVGTVVGVLPGIGPLSGISILLPATFGLDTTKSVVMLAGIYYGSQYGGSTTSILMRIPGEASSVMTCIDGYAMAQKGRAGAALCIAAVGSWIGGTFGVLVLTVVAPPLATLAVRFGPPEYTALLILGLIFLAYMSSSSLVRTLLMACLGLMFGMIGIDNMTGHFRYSFDIKELGDGIGIVPVAVGLFGLGEILATPSHTVVGEVITPKFRELLPNRREWRESIMPIARGSVLGFIIGIIPGSAHIISSFLSYALEKKVSKHPEEFGKGAVAE